MKQVYSGLSLLFKKHAKLLTGKRVALLCHPASVDHHYQHVVEIFRQQQINLVSLFGPEHGIRGEAQDMEGVHESIDPVSNLKVYSLYGSHVDSLYPTENSLKDVDVLVVDLQDIGSRYYTFIYTMAFCMKVAKKTGTQVVVLDRPNPINGKTLEGNLIDPGFESFVGAFSLPVRHGMTIGELALLFNEQWDIHCDLKIINMQSWHRGLYVDEFQYPWITPSPNMPTVDTAVVYPGMCLLEATTLSEGRGTTRPFEFFGAPYIDPETLVKKLNSYHLPQVKFRPIYFKPQFQKHAGLVCGGAQLHVGRRKAFLPLLTGMKIIEAIKELYPKEFGWRAQAYEFVDKIPAIDLLTGNEKFRKYIDSGKDTQILYQSYEAELAVFKEIRKKYLLYNN